MKLVRNAHWEYKSSITHLINIHCMSANKLGVRSVAKKYRIWTGKDERMAGEFRARRLDGAKA